MSEQVVTAYLDRGTRNFRQIKPIGRSNVKLYCNSCGQHCETVGRLNDRIPCTKTDGILPTWRDVDLRSFYYESHERTVKTQEGQKKWCRICERQFLSYNNRHSCEPCRTVISGSNLFKTEAYTGILYDEKWLPVAYVATIIEEYIIPLIEDKAEKMGIELRYRVFCGKERVAKYGRKTESEY